MKRFLAFAVVAAVALGGLTQGASASYTLYDILKQSNGTPDKNLYDYDLLRAAVELLKSEGRPEVRKKLKKESECITLFAPNDKAFVRLAREYFGYDGWDEGEALEVLLGALDLDTLEAVVLYHIGQGKVTAGGLVWKTWFGKKIHTCLDGAKIRPCYFKLIDNEPDLCNPRVRKPYNKWAKNGVWHTIDRVLIPVDLP
jgi:uncharacterized surface protein with fasciclin (FAS1) repeats